jgi:UDP-N-acetylmuramyl tripeptide synthase
MENYVQTKLLLFKNLYKYGIRRDIRKVGVVNLDSPYASEFISKDIVVDAMHTYGVSPRASIRAENIVASEMGVSFDVRMASSKFHIDSKLQGEFNVMNILAASAVLISQKVPLETITKTIAVIG